MNRDKLSDFIQKSNAIEGIFGEISSIDVETYEKFLSYSKLVPEHIVSLVQSISSGRLRSSFGLNVRVGNHEPPLGNPNMWKALDRICFMILEGEKPEIVHLHYLHLHPFTDGNGRSGRAIWLWQMINQIGDPKLDFLHWWYYESLAYGDRKEFF